jgi:predicted PurR-regulated permease PerM
VLIVSAVLSATMKPIAATLSKYLIQRAVSSLLKYLYIRHNYYLGSEDLV